MAVSNPLLITLADCLLFLNHLNNSLQSWNGGGNISLNEMLDLILFISHMTECSIALKDIVHPQSNMAPPSPSPSGDRNLSKIFQGVEAEPSPTDINDSLKYMSGESFANHGSLSSSPTNVFSLAECVSWDLSRLNNSVKSFEGKGFEKFMTIIPTVVSCLRGLRGFVVPSTDSHDDIASSVPSPSPSAHHLTNFYASSLSPSFSRKALLKPPSPIHVIASSPSPSADNFISSSPPPSHPRTLFPPKALLNAPLPIHVHYLHRGTSWKALEHVISSPSQGRDCRAAVENL